MSVNLPQVQTEPAAGRSRVLHVHRNVPGVLATVNGVLADSRVNIERQVLSTRGELGYVITDVAGELTPALVDKLESLPETVRAARPGLTPQPAREPVARDDRCSAFRAACADRSPKRGSGSAQDSGPVEQVGQPGRAAGVGGRLLPGPPAHLAELGGGGRRLRSRPAGAGATKVTVTWRSPASVTKYSDSR